MKSLKLLYKFFYWSLLILLAAGASIGLGLLSGTGMLALAPALPVVAPIVLSIAAIVVFVLAIAYEGEIYFKNIKSAFEKLFKKDYLKQRLAKDYLLEKLSEHEKEAKELDTEDQAYPQFFKDYEAQLRLVHEYTHKNLTAASKKDKLAAEKKLRRMEKFFTKQLFLSRKQVNSSNLTAYEIQLQNWLKEHNQETWQALLQQRRSSLFTVKVVSIAAAVFMSFGTTYLLLEAVAAVPLLAAIPFSFLPLFVVPMAILAGVAYGFLTYNAISDMVNNQTLRTWYNIIKKDFSKFKEGNPLVIIRTLVMSAAAVVFAGMAIALTICTAGTWWTIAKTAQPIFSWMAEKTVSSLLGIGIPLFTGISQLGFNLVNMFSSWYMIRNVLKAGHFFAGIKESWQDLRSRENFFQIINPVRLLLKLIFLPIRIALFLGHVISIALTSDQVPGVSPIVTSAGEAGMELVVDFHIFFDDHHHGHEHDDHHHHNDHHNHADHDSIAPTHEHEEKKLSLKKLLKERHDQKSSHEHGVDIPQFVLKVAFSPLIFLAAFWDWTFSQLNPKKVVIETATEQPSSVAEENVVAPLVEEIQIAEPVQTAQPITEPLNPAHSHKTSNRFAMKFSRAFGKHWGNEEEVSVDAKPAELSVGWHKQETFDQIDKQIKHHEATIIKQDISRTKITKLNDFRQTINEADNVEQVKTTIETEKSAPEYKQNRIAFFGAKEGKNFSTELFDRKLVGVAGFGR